MELCTWISKDAWLLWRGRVGTCPLKAKGMFSGRILGVIEIDLAVENLYCTPSQALPLLPSKFFMLNVELIL
jgi:hypothetical protein